MDFLSERNIMMHREYLSSLKIKRSIFEKSYPDISKINVKRGRMKRNIGSEAREYLSLSCEIEAHECFFDSFRGGCERHGEISRQSSLSLIYELTLACEACDRGFLFIFKNREEIGYLCTDDYVGFYSRHTPVLALDLYEHAYFYDYGFDKKRYVRNALDNFNFEKL